MLIDVRDRVAIVTGGNQGIGFAIACGLAEYGAKVVISNRREEEGEKAAKSIVEKGGYAISVPVDVSKKESVQTMVDETIKTLGKVDILVNNSGVIIRKEPEDHTEEDWDYTLDINLKGTFLCCQAVGRQMIERKYGKIINLSSIGAASGLKVRSAYCASKGGVSQLTRALAMDWGKHNINVNALAPGGIFTEMSEGFFEKGNEAYMSVVNRVALKRWGAPKDIAGMAIFLASPASDWITGQTIYIDGGFTIS